MDPLSLIMVASSCFAAGMLFDGASQEAIDRGHYRWARIRGRVFLLHASIAFASFIARSIIYLYPPDLSR